MPLNKDDKYVLGFSTHSVCVHTCHKNLWLRKPIKMYNNPRTNQLTGKMDSANFI